MCWCDPSAYSLSSLWGLLGSICPCPPAVPQQIPRSEQALTSVILALSRSPLPFPLPFPPLSPFLSPPLSPFMTSVGLFMAVIWNCKHVYCHCWASQSQRNIRQLVVASLCATSWWLYRTSGTGLSDLNSQLHHRAAGRFEHVSSTC